MKIKTKLQIETITFHTKLILCIKINNKRIHENLGDLKTYPVEESCKAYEKVENLNPGHIGTRGTGDPCGALHINT